jgi:NADPH-dependent 2,4-dienoyl-CoA reductase/sulfur reductase-like enzyme
VTHYTYLIIGGGMTGDAATRGIRDVDPSGTIGLISAELDPPYKRPPLSKKLWQGKAFESIWSKTESRGVALHLGRSVRSLDLPAKQATDDQGAVYTYDKLLLATGGTVRRLPVDGAGTVYFRTVEDYRRLRALADRSRRFAVIGGGFIASEIAAALRMNGNDVAMFFPEEAIGSRLYPPGLARFLNDFYREKGVEVRPGESIVAVDEREDGVELTTDSGDSLTVDGVVAGIGIQPNVELAVAAGLAVDNGIVVDETLQTSHPDVYAAGDVAVYCDAILGKRRRVEHEDNAITMGRWAGRSMAGQPAPYRHLPFFYTDLFDLGYEAVGDLDARLETFVDWKEPCREGVVYYLDAGRVRGVLLWNVWGQVDAARELIAEPGPFRPSDLAGRIGGS